MHHDDDTSVGSVAEPLLTMFQTLRSVPGGPELLAQIERGHDVTDALRALIERAFLTFLRNAVDRHARTTGTDRVTRLKIKLIEQRLAKLVNLHLDPGRVPELPDAASLTQHLVAQMWAAGKAATPKPPQPATSAAASPLFDRLEHLKPLQQTLTAELDNVARANLESIASLGNIELTLKAAEPGELETWREILRDTAREVIEDYRKLGENLRHVQRCTDEIGREIETPEGVASSAGGFTVNQSDLLRRIEAEIRRTERYHHPLALALLGPDQLESIRVLVGPQAANEVLRRYLENVTSRARAYDTVVGCSPHKLLWLLPGADTDQGVKALRKAQDQLISEHYHFAGRLRPLPTFSAGVVGYARGEKPTHFLARAEVLAAHARRIGPSHIEWDRRRIPKLQDTVKD